MISSDKIEESSQVLRHEIKKLDELGLTFAAALVRIADLDLQMRIHNVTDKEIDLVSFVAMLAEQQKTDSAAEPCEEACDATDVAAGADHVP